MKKYILSALLLIAVALPASAQILSLKAGISARRGGLHEHPDQ
ncbi:MAG: hypothetical protein U0176_15155 [Bacteroidia bacterium]